MFQASAPADLRVALGGSPKFDDDESISYYLVLGGEDNMFSWISKQMNGIKILADSIKYSFILKNVIDRFVRD